MKWARHQGTLRSTNRNPRHKLLIIVQGCSQNLGVQQLRSLLSCFSFADKVLLLGEMSEVRSFVREPFELLAPDLFREELFPS